MDLSNINFELFDAIYVAIGFVLGSILVLIYANNLKKI